ncbi:MAG TPA: undecaprenyl-phosphate glucose phosphotransferase [Ignavibacteriales bacterium]|nr:undecaprenyl-phosphate glucose phosphotransferase [Ignavibacteriales bacterium]
MNKNLQKITLFILDFFTINLSYLIYYYIRVNTGLFNVIIVPDVLSTMLIMYIYWILWFMFVGMYREWFAFSRFDELNVLFKVTFIGIFLLFAFIFWDDYATGESNAQRFLIFLYWAILFVIVGSGRIVLRSIQRKLLIKGIGRRNALIVGFNEKAFEMHEKILENRHLGLDVIGYISVDKENIGKSYNNVMVIAGIDQIKEIIDLYNIKEIIIALSQKYDNEMLEVISKCDYKNVGIKIVPDLYEIISGSARTIHIYGFPLIDVFPEIMPVWAMKVKRLMDIVAAIIILVLSAPVCLITAIAIKLESKGPVLFKQERSGLNGEPFMMYKFRSMRQDAEAKTGPVWASKNDPRVTKVGKFIRKVRIDEIPQMINVLKGEMSLVGPRPERPVFVEKFAQEIPLYKKRLKVRPGVTGWAQVNHKYDETIEDVKKKLKYDLFYIENMSIRMDIKIMFKTAVTMIFGKGHFS